MEGHREMSKGAGGHFSWDLLEVLNGGRSLGKSMGTIIRGSFASSDTNPWPEVEGIEVVMGIEIS